MYCEICQAFSARYCTCQNINDDDGKPIDSASRGEEMKIKMEKFSSFVDELSARYPSDKGLDEVRTYFGMPDPK